MELGYLLEMKGMRKDYSGVTVLKNVDLSLKEGEVLALVGENGAGKSTLIKLLAGSIPATAGEIWICGEKMNFESPMDAIEHGISVIYQELNYYRYLSVAENIYAGRLPVKKGTKRIDWKKLKEDAQKVLDSIGVEIEPEAEVDKLSVAQKQLVEIAKAASRNNRIIVMDEPTATLNDKETEGLFRLILRLKKQGVSVIYISHRLEELFGIADRVMVLRDGAKIGEMKIQEADREGIIRMMVGRDIVQMYPKKKAQIGDIMLEVRDVSGGIIKDVSLNVRKGEIVSLFGLMGCGQTEVLEQIFGALKKDAGEILIEGKVVKIKRPQDAIKAGIAYVPPERKTTGLCLIQSIKQNILAPSIGEYKKGLGIDRKREEKDVEASIQKLAIKCQNMSAEVKALSGGNQQKVLLAKWILKNPKIILINEPTRGVDVGTKTEIYAILEELCREGFCILMISSELPETLGLSDRIYVMCKGRITGEFSREEAGQEKLMEYAIGW